MADKIIWQLGADASQVRAEMNSAAASVNKATKQMADASEKLDKSQDKKLAKDKRLLESNNRVTNQFQGFTRTLLSARNATDVVVSGLDRLENSLNLSLGAGFALAGGAVVLQQISAAREEYKKLGDELKAVYAAAQVSGEFKTLAKLEEDAKKAEAAIKQLNTAIETREGKKGAWQWIKQGFADFAATPFAIPGTGRPADDPKELARARASQERLMQDMVSKRSARSDLRADTLAGAPDYEIKAREIQLAHDEANHAVHMMTQAAIELNLAFKELAKSVTEQHMNRAGMSLKELGAIPQFAQAGTTYEQLKAGQEARRAIELEQQAEAARLNFQPEAAHQLFNQAGEIKDNLTNLKPSEKMEANFKGALIVTEQHLKIIADNTGGMFRGR